MKKHSRKKPQQNKLGENKKEGTFFNKTNDTQPQAVQKKEESGFFQAKSDGIKLGKPGDKFEQEADSTAEDVVNKKEGDSPQLMEDSVNGIQRYMTNAQEDELGSNTMRIEKDKYIQEKAETTEKEEIGSSKEEEEMVNSMEEEEIGSSKEEEEMVNSMKEEEMGSSKEEEEMVNSMEEEEMGSSKEEEEIGQAKSDSNKNASNKQEKNKQPNYGETVPPKVQKILEKCKGKGQPMPKKIKVEMEAKFGVDFSNVRIHTGQNAIELSEILHAQAFTYGMDIYFNAGKFNPETINGKLLLAHELTHIIQQQGGKNKKV